MSFLFFIAESISEEGIRTPNSINTVGITLSAKIVKFSTPLISNNGYFLWKAL